MPTYKELAKELRTSKKKIGFNSRLFEKIATSLESINFMQAMPVDRESVATMAKLEAELKKNCEEYLKSRAEAGSAFGKARYGIVNQVKQLCEADNPDALRDPIKFEQAKGKPWRDVMAEARIPTIDVSAQQVKYVGSGMSKRMVISVNGEEGFFSETGRTVTVEETFDTLISELPAAERKDYLDAKAAITDMNKLGEIFFIQKYDFLDDLKIPDDKKGAVLEKLKAVGLKTDGTLEDLSKKGKFLKDMHKASVGRNAISTAGISADSDMAKRHEASTRMANALGVGGLLAESRQVNVMTADGLKHGVIMAKAEGVSVLDESADVKSLLEGFTDYSAPSLQQDCADMQILDLICGQIDRHAGNRFIKFSLDKNGIQQPVGIQGIDNDLSFGVYDDLEQTHTAQSVPIKISDLKKITVVSKKMADAVNNLTDEFLEFTFADVLSKKEMKALENRVQKVREHINQKTVEKVEGANWNAATADKLADDGNAYLQDYSFVAQNNVKSLIAQAQPYSPTQLRAADKAAKNAQPVSPTAESRRKAVEITEGIRASSAADARHAAKVADPKKVGVVKKSPETAIKPHKN